MLSHSGVFASSKSASHTLAPEFRALMVIFCVGRPGDLDPPVDQARGRRRDPPATVGPDVLGLGQEVQARPGAQLLLAGSPGGEELSPALAELTLEAGDQVQLPAA